MKILVTGVKGYLGSKFINQYGNDFEIVEFDLKDGDNILDYQYLSQKMKGCIQVVHLAAIPKPNIEKSFSDYFDNNVKGTLNVLQAAFDNKVQRVIYASSTSVYGIEKGIPFSFPITESQPFISQYISSENLKCRDIDLSYHLSKVMAEQILAWYGLNKKLQTIALRFGPINKVFLGTSVSINNATKSIELALKYKGECWYEAFSIVDELPHISILKAKNILGYKPEKPKYTQEQIHSKFEERTKLES